MKAQSRKEFERLAVEQIKAMAKDLAANWGKKNHVAEFQHGEIAATLLAGALSEMAYGPDVATFVKVERAETTRTLYWK